MTSMYEGYYIGLTLVVLVAVDVWRDADNRGDSNAKWWGLGTLLLLIVVLPLYLYHRAYGSSRTVDASTELGKTVEKKEGGMRYVVTCRCGHAINA